MEAGSESQPSSKSSLRYVAPAGGTLTPTKVAIALLVLLHGSRIAVEMAVSNKTGAVACICHLQSGI